MEEGWKRRMVASEPRLSEIVEMYENLGFEVRLEPLDPSDPGWDEDECTICLEDPGEAERTRVVYTRPKQDGSPSPKKEDLFE
ncbi:MAG: hypothetical protein KAJ35_05325 [Thermoplasmata archaeon]|nr:hypothetical protein [Thermoplasmata archaeon]